jgi:hypothetical protein
MLPSARNIPREMCPAMAPETRSGGRAATLVLVAASIVLSIGLAELGFQLYARLVIFPAWDRDMAKPNFFLRRSEDPTPSARNTT